MSIKLKINIDSSEKILKSLNLEKDGLAQQYFTSECARIMDAYVPMLSGLMKNTVIVELARIIYPQIYSAKQYKDNKGDGRRGANWGVRSMLDRGDELLQSVAVFLGGKVK